MTVHTSVNGVPLDNLVYEKRDHLAIIRLDNAERGNAVSGAMGAGLAAIWADIDTDPEVRAVIVTGSGERHFCTGADLSGPTESTGRLNDGPFRKEVAWTSRQNEVWKPTICALNGLVAGAGLHFVVDADIVVAAEHAAFTDTHVNVGLVSSIDGIGLARRIPLGSAMRLCLSGRHYRMGAQRAFDIGLVDEVVPAADLMDEAEQIAGAIAKNSPRAVSLTQQAVWNSFEMGLSAAHEYGWALTRMHWSHPDFAEGPQAFAQRRDPEWKGD